MSEDIVNRRVIQWFPGHMAKTLRLMEISQTIAIPIWIISLLNRRNVSGMIPGSVITYLTI